MANDDSIGVGRGFEGSKTASNDESASQETTESSLLVGRGREMSDRPEEDGSKRVESETHENRDLVALALENFSGNGRKAEVTTAEVHDLETGRLETRNAENCLEMLVEDIEKTVRETPEEEERDDQAQRVDELLAAEISAGNARDIGWNSTTSHCRASTS